MDVEVKHYGIVVVFCVRFLAVSAIEAGGEKTVKDTLIRDSGLTIVVPVYNEEATVINLLTKVVALKKDIHNLEIVVIDDGSTDTTRLLLESNQKLYDLLIICKKNRGKGAAIIEALNQVHTKFILVQDADLEYDPKEITRLWSIVLEHRAQVVHTNRLSGSTLTRVHYFWHKVGNKFITFLFNFSNNTTFGDIYSGYLMFDINLLDIAELKFQGWGQQAEILTLLVSRAETIFEIPINYFGRTYAEGKKIRAIATIGVVSAIIYTRFRVFVHNKFRR